MIKKEDLVNQSDQSLSNSPKKPKGLTIILISVLLLTTVGVGGYMLGARRQQSSPTGILTNPQSNWLPTVTPTQQVSPTPTIVVNRTEPTVGWKQFAATDSDFGVTTTLSLPPAFSFRFTGSEFTIQNDSDATELWDYSTSVFIGKDGLKNYYTGGSRRAWYENYLSVRQNYPIYEDKYKDKILNVSEIPINGTSYLVISVETPAYNDHGEISGTKKVMHFAYVQNGMMHIIKPASHKANSSTAQIPNYIGTIFASLKASRTK